METPVLIALLVLVVVGFFGWQWFQRRGRATAASSGNKAAAPLAATAPTVEKPMAPVAAAAAAVAPPKEEVYPEVVGQTEADLRAKEPLQRAPTQPRPQPVTADGLGPAAVEDNLRHPEQMFHAPPPSAIGAPTSDVAAGRAATTSTPGLAGGPQQAFTPEMAQNGGAFIGNSVFAFDGMEPTTYASF
jgi:hypothetical protein